MTDRHDTGFGVGNLAQTPSLKTEQAAKVSHLDTPSLGRKTLGSRGSCRQSSRASPNRLFAKPPTWWLDLVRVSLTFLSSLCHSSLGLNASLRSACVASRVFTGGVFGLLRGLRLILKAAYSSFAASFSSGHRQLRTVVSAVRRPFRIMLRDQGDEDLPTPEPDPPCLPGEYPFPAHLRENGTYKVVNLRMYAPFTRLVPEFMTLTPFS